MVESVITNCYDFSHLPSHVLVNILLRLKLDDFKNAVQTCQSWYYASCDPQITRYILVNGPKISADIEYVRRPIRNLRLDQVDLNKFDFRKLLANFGKTIVDVEIRVLSTLALTRIFEIFVYLPNVRTLDIYLGSNLFSAQNFYTFKLLQEYRDTISKNLGNIKYLTMHTRMRDLQGIKIFLNHCTNLEKLHWDESIYLPHHQIEFICEYLLEPRENPVITNIKDLLIGCIHRNDNDRFLSKLIDTPFPNLRQLYIKEILESCNTIIFRLFCQAYHYLEDFTMNRCNEQQLSNICKYMENLKCLRLQKCRAHNLVNIGQLPRIESLHLDRVEDIRNDKLIELLSLKLPNLAKLTINDVDENLLAVICETYKNLEYLSLTRVETKKLKPIFKNLLNLRVLKLWFNQGAPCNSRHMDIFADCNVTRLTKLEELYVSCWVPGLTPALVRQSPKLQRSSVLDDTWDLSDAEFAARATAMERRVYRTPFLRPMPEEINREYELTDFDSALYNSILE